MRRTKCYRLSVLTSVYGRYGDAAFKIMRGIVNVLQILGNHSSPHSSMVFKTLKSEP